MMDYRLTPITAPTVEPITLAEAKSQARVDTSDEDTLIASMISAAREHAEVLTGRQLVTATYDLTLDGFPATGIIELPRPPLQSVTSISYVDADGAPQTLDSGTYTVDTSGLIGRVFLNYGESWPSTRDQLNAVTIRYVCGWPVVESVATTPECIRAWLKLRVASLYAQRESFVVGLAVTDMPGDFVPGLLDPYRIRVVV